ncbi:hypothetical protein [Mycobacteroides abscessus]|uniref:hypothetical protein n=1 Tax=Mycobacteroides abscessus TaxID=36809 RepID=UPI0012FFFAE3|nr:hypothetical protein [Mycobacteroides abscessus]
MQIIEQWCLVGIGNDKVIEVEAFVESTVEVAPDVVGYVTVEPLRIFNQVECIAQYLGTDRELFVGAGQSRFQAHTFLFEFVEFLPDFVAGHEVISGKIDQAGFFSVNCR